MCLFLIFWIIKFTIMCFLTFTHVISYLRSSTCQKITIPSKNKKWSKLIQVCFLTCRGPYLRNVMHLCQKIVNFIIHKLKNKHISLKKCTDWAILGHVTQNLEFWFQCRKCAPEICKDFKLSPRTSLFSLKYGLWR